MAILDFEILLQRLELGDPAVFDQDGGGAVIGETGVLFGGFFEGDDVVEADEEKDEEGEGEDGVEEEEEDFHNAADEFGDVEDVGEEEEEDGTEEVEDCGDDGEYVGRFVHVGSNHACGDQEGCFEDEEDDGLSEGVGLSEGDDEALGEGVEEERDHEVKGLRSVVDI